MALIHSRIFLLVLFCIFGGHAHASNHKSIKLSGDILQIALPAIAFGTTLGIKDFKGSQEFITGFAATAATAYGLKFAINEKRPNHGSHSFPSGHAAIAFYGGGFIHHRYGLQYAAAAYAAAFFVGYTRVSSNEHWIHDIVAGAAIGLLYSYLLTTPYKCESYRIYPALIPNGAALCCEKEF